MVKKICNNSLEWVILCIYLTACPNEEGTMKKYLIPIALVITLLAFAGVSFAEIRVVSVKGAASYKAGGQWVPLQAGAVLAAGTKISTGVRSKVEIKINRHTVTVEPLTIMKISESFEDGKNSNTRIGLRRGSIRSNVARDARIKTVFRVSTPVATSSVRGTLQLSSSGPTFGTNFSVPINSAQIEGKNSGPQLISGSLNFEQKPDKGDSENPMSGMKQNQVQTHSQFVSSDENEAFGLFGDDFMFYKPGGQKMGGSQPVPVRIMLIWP